MRLGLVLTNDWELFGDGSGDYFELQHRPLQALLTAAEDHGARITVMAEVGQQWAHLEVGARESWAREIADAWEAMLRETIKRRSDVQLHLHPQWLHAKCDDARRWQVDFAWWATAALPVDILEAALLRGKHYLERLLQPVDAAYACIAFRAGAYCIQPSRRVIAALRRAGFRCDSSVSKGLVQPPFYDYRDAHSNVVPWFTGADDVRWPDAPTAGAGAGLLELPIYAQPAVDMPILRKVISPALYYRLFHGVRVPDEDRRWLSEQRRTRGRRYPMHRRLLRGGRSRSVRWWLAQALSHSVLQLDYDALPPSLFVRLLEGIVENPPPGLAECVLPVVASGHTKDMHSTANIARILAAVNARLGGRVEYWTLREAIDFWTDAAPPLPRRVALGRSA